MITPEAQTAKAKDAICALLEKSNVRRILYIDDRFDIANQKEAFIGLVKSLKNRLSHRPGKKPSFDFIEDWAWPEPAFSLHVGRKWDSATPEQKGNYLNTVSLQLNDTDYVAVDLLESNFQDIFQKLTPIEWDEQKERLFQELGENEKYVCLFDYELNDGRNGGQLVQTLLNSPNALKVYCGIYSQVLSPKDEHSKKEEWQEALGVNNFYPISKKRFQDEPSIAGFCNGLRNVLIVNHIEELKKKSIEIIDTSFNEVKGRIQKIHPDTFNFIVQGNSREEGIWEIETFFRLSNILMDQETKKSLLPADTRERFNKSINHIRAIDLIETVNPDRFYQDQIKQIEEDEKFYSSEMINQLHYPLRNGDIFKVKDKEFILLCQPCNLSIRKDGKRANDIEHAFLLEIKGKERMIDEKRVKLDESIEVEVKSFDLDSDNIRYVKFSKFVTAQLSLLDLVSYQDDGIARIDLNVNENSLSHVIHTPLIKRYKELKKEFKKYADIIKSYSTIIGNRTDREQGILKTYVTSPKCLSDFKIDGIECYKTDNNSFEFPIKRIKNYKSTYSIDLLKRFMNHLSRTGFDKDFI